MYEAINSRVIEKLAQTDEKHYQATNNVRLILAEDGVTLSIGYQPDNEPSNEDVVTAMQEFLKN